jgi:hypothetical protein
MSKGALLNAKVKGGEDAILDDGCEAPDIGRTGDPRSRQEYG